MSRKNDLIPPLTETFREIVKLNHGGGGVTGELHVTMTDVTIDSLEAAKRKL